MDRTLACLSEWMPRQRWYSGKGSTPTLRRVAAWDAPSPEPGVHVRTLLVSDDGPVAPVLYQVPVVARPPGTVTVDDEHVIGAPEPGLTLVDGPYDPAYADALLGLVTRGGTRGGPDGIALGHPAAAAPPVSGEHPAAVLRGEQSNTSVIYRALDESTPVICKVFRQVGVGVNPDIEVQSALSDAGSRHIARVIGWVDAEWRDGSGERPTGGALAFAQEYLEDVEDAWRVALRAATSAEDPTATATGIGDATAAVHAALADLFPTAPSDTDARSQTLDDWMRRLDDAAAAVPDLAGRAEAISAVYRRALEVAWPRRQRVHGDLHLGQVLHAPGRGFILLDFEGEPLRPMAQRRLPDLAARDVAGMLRSFDYVAGSLLAEQPPRDTAQLIGWARTARDAFLAGYAARSGEDPMAWGPLLSALELDKAVYEALYEARNRPAWLPIPLHAIDRLSASRH